MASLQDIRNRFRGPSPVTSAAAVTTNPTPKAIEGSNHPFVMFWSAPGKTKTLKGWVLRILPDANMDGRYKATAYWGPANSSSDITGRRLSQRSTVIRGLTAAQAQSHINAQVASRIKKGYTLLGAATVNNLFILPESS